MATDIRTSPSRPLVLFVDDDADTREMYTLGLSCEGLDVLGARDGTEAYRRALESHPDAIVTDLSLPGTDGWALIGRLRHDLSTQHIPLVVLTGQGEPALRQRAQHEGCAALVLKPCLPGELAIELRQALARSIAHQPGPAAN